MTVEKARRAWARAVVAAGGGEAAPLDLVVAVAAAVARASSVDPDDLLATLDLPAADLVGIGGDAMPEPVGGWADPWLVGLVNEQAVGGAERSARGAWYTPEAVVRGLVRLATADRWRPVTVVDPTCGGGAFLLASLDRLVELGIDPGQAMDRVTGTDIDPEAVTTSRLAMALWGAMAGVADAGSRAVRAVTVADALAPASGPGGDESERPGDRLVIGNPPFASPLRAGGLGPVASSVRAANQELVGPYADLAAVHLVAALGSVGPGSTVALVLPQSILAGRDTEALRRHCDRHAPLQALWATREAVFDAGVRACAVVVRPGGPRRRAVVLAAGPEVTLVDAPASVSESSPVCDAPADPTTGHDDDDGRWGRYAARALGSPPLPPPLSRSSPGVGRLGDLVRATAGFRDEYYGLVAACREWADTDGEPNRLVTVGSVDPLTLGWGQAPTRFGGRRWRRPVIDLDALEPRIRSWVDQRLVPKVVLATQSKVLEPVVDRDGQLVPATPLLSIEADLDALDRVAAVLLAPPVVAWAWERWFGSALSVDALKLAARQVAELPLPADSEAWGEAAAVVAAARADPSGVGRHVDRVATIMNLAYGADDTVLAWWRNRAGSGRGPGRSRGSRPGG